MSKHTPGLWTLREHTGHKNEIGAIDDGGCELLRAKAYGCSPDEIEANARRIVACVNACAGINPEAVPDLLEACKRVLEAWENIPETVEVPEEINDSDDWNWDIVRDAIAKAEAS